MHTIRVELVFMNNEGKLNDKYKKKISTISEEVILLKEDNVEEFTNILKDLIRTENLSSYEMIREDQCHIKLNLYLDDRNGKNKERIVCVRRI